MAAFESNLKANFENVERLTNTSSKKSRYGTSHEMQC